MNIWDLVWAVIGLWIGGIANAIWYWKWAIYDARRGKPLGKYRHPLLTLFEHYHWATIAYILCFRLHMPFFGGMATIWLIDEAVAQNHKFAIGSGHEVPSMLLEVLILLLWALIELPTATPLPH
jgi:hypothetical protein